MAEKALDVSEYQGRVKWSEVHGAGYHHAFAKATEGIAEVDHELERNAHNAREAGVKLALYHFAHPSESAKGNAHHFLRTALGVKALHVGDPCPVLDLEVAEGHDKRSLWRWQHTWGEIVGEALGCTTALYSSASFLMDDLWLPLHHRPIWGAAWGHVPAWQLARWHAWQYSAAGRVPGISGLVDLDSILRPFPTIGRIP